MNDTNNNDIHPDDDHLYTKEEMAKKLRICPRHLQTLTKRRLIPVTMLGKAVRYDWIEVRGALKKLTIQAR